MKESPLKLEDYFFTRIDIRANKQFNPEKEGGKGRLDTNLRFLRNKEDPSRWQVVLSVDVKGEDPEDYPYYGNIEVVGIFQMTPLPDDDEHESKARRIVGANCPAILFSAAREMFLIICGRGPWPAPQWPTVHFQDTIPAPNTKSVKDEYNETGEI